MHFYQENLKPAHPLPSRSAFLHTFSRSFSRKTVGSRVLPLSTQQVEWHVKDGDCVPAGQVLGKVTGLASSILVAERVALNFMQVWANIKAT